MVTCTVTAVDVWQKRVISTEPTVNTQISIRFNLLQLNFNFQAS